VHLFDDHLSMAEGAATFLHDGFERDGTLLANLPPYHWSVLAQALAARGVPVSSAIDSGRLIVLDAAQTLRQFMRNGRPDPDRFRAVVGAPVEQIAARGSRIWVYGEMADLLVAEGEFDAARQLESLGNALCAHHPVSVLCGYSAVNFGHPRSAAVLRQICRAHADVRCAPADGLSAFLVDTHARA
jgi:hypothetical protein